MAEKYLIHYGIKGMRWGVRTKKDIVSAKQAYKKAKKDYEESEKNFSKDPNADNLKKIKDHYGQLVEAKAVRKALKAKTPDKAEKAYIKSYDKSIRKAINSYDSFEVESSINGFNRHNESALLSKAYDNYKKFEIMNTKVSAIRETATFKLGLTHTMKLLEKHEDLLGAKTLGYIITQQEIRSRISSNKK